MSSHQWGNQSSFSLKGLRQELLGKLGRPEEALQTAWEEFERHPGVYRYEEVMKYVPKKDVAQWHEKAIDAARKGALSDFMEICVKTRERDILAERIDSVKHEDLEHISHYVTEKAAKILTKTYPHTAAKIHRALGMRLVKAGKSKYYQYALEHFQKAKTLYEKSGRQQEWSTLVDNVRKNHARKYSFINRFEAIASGKTLKSPDSFERRIQKRWQKQTSG